MICSISACRSDNGTLPVVPSAAQTITITPEATTSRQGDTLVLAANVRSHSGPVLYIWSYTDTALHELVTDSGQILVKLQYPGLTDVDVRAVDSRSHELLGKATAHVFVATRNIDARTLMGFKRVSLTMRIRGGYLDSTTSSGGLPRAKQDTGLIELVNFNLPSLASESGAVLGVQRNGSGYSGSHGGGGGTFDARLTTDLSFDGSQIENLRLRLYSYYRDQDIMQTTENVQLTTFNCARIRVVDSSADSISFEEFGPELLSSLTATDSVIVSEASGVYQSWTWEYRKLVTLFNSNEHASCFFRVTFKR